MKIFDLNGRMVKSGMSLVFAVIINKYNLSNIMNGIYNNYLLNLKISNYQFDNDIYMVKNQCTIIVHRKHLNR